MKFTGLLLLLNSYLYTGYAYVSLTVSPKRSQFFKYESLALSCGENKTSSEWRVKSKTERGVSDCGSDSTCVISEAYSWNSGEYWCESTSGERSPAANITVTGNKVILESPLFPVTEGESVVLRCTPQKNSSNLQASIFMKNRSAVGAAMTGLMTIPAVSKSDEGLYMCITETGESPESWLIVRERAGAGGFTGDETPEPDPDPDADAAARLSVSRLVCHLVVGIPYLLSSILLGLIYRDKSTTQRVQETKNRNDDDDDVKMEEIV